MTAPMSAMDTIAPQQFGAGNAVGVGLTAQRAMITGLALWALLPLVVGQVETHIDRVSEDLQVLLCCLPFLSQFRLSQCAHNYVLAGVL